MAGLLAALTLGSGQAGLPGPYTGNIQRDKYGNVSQTSLAPGFTIVNGQFYYQGKPLTKGQSLAISKGEFEPFTPYETSTSAPPGTYDPAYDAQLENANQGFAWAAQDHGLADLRTGEDYGTAMSRLGASKDQGLADLLRGYTRAGEDYNTSKTRGTQDYGLARTRGAQDYSTATGDIQRGYHDLGDQQQSQIYAAGDGEGGALAQSLAKRQVNQSRDQGRLDQSYQRGTQDLDTGYQRGMQDLDTGYQRYGQDYNTGVDRTNQQYDWQSTDLGTQRQRALDDSGTTYTRQGIQNATFGQQINAQKTFQAQQAGMLPTGPDDEFTNSKTGQNYREVMSGGTLYHRYPDGSLVPIRKVK